MNALVFDSLAYAARLEAAGFSRPQAEALAHEQALLLNEQLATKTDVELIRADTKRESEASRADTKREFEAIRADTKRESEAIRADTKRELELIRADIAALRESTAKDLRVGLAETRAEMVKWIVGSLGLQTLAILGAIFGILRLMLH